MLVAKIDEILKDLRTVEQKEHVFRLFHIAEKLGEHFNDFGFVFLCLRVFQQ